MNGNLGIIDYNDHRVDKRLAIFISARCPHCQRMAIRTIDCPDHLQGAQPGSFATVDQDGRLQVGGP